MAETSPGQSVQLDAHTLRGLAHPVRVQILNILTIDGPSTSTALAERLQVRTGTTSWHLQKLAEHGFIEEIPERGNKRERWWRAVATNWSVDAAEFLADPELAGPVSTLLLEQINQYFQRTARFLGEDWSYEWNQAWILNSWGDLRLTPQRLDNLREDLMAVIDRYRDDPVTEDPAAESVMIQIEGFPFRSRNS
ncbi:MAG TPA: helix-turn-helix domain-containing protein [Mycobacteriales bacterium]|nr:helix-turn-helix domain-containing protein [Mycobacteriales bacterium]